MSDCWKILGIEPTENKREVRSAYAAKSRLFHMEENPEEFAKLNQAYQEALGYASAHKGGQPEQRESASDFQKIMQGNEIQKEQDMGTEERENAQERVEATESPELSDTSDPSSSLLHRLQQAEEARIQESITEGALKDFIAIFEGARESGKVPRADVWKEFFLSEEFLKEQYEEGFAKGMIQYLSEWSMEGNYHVHALPSNFLLELAIAYALKPEQMDSFSSSQNRYEVNAGGSFYGRECAASLWNGQSGGTLPIRILYKPENLVRLRSFSDYIRLRSLNQNNLLTPGNKSNWEEIVNRGYISYLYEQKGKGNQNIYEGTRSVCLIHLFTFWVREEEVPACVLEYMYQHYNLKNVEHSSSKKIYNPLKQEILKKYPDIEEVLYGAESRSQMESDWYKDLTKIVADNHSDYDKGIYEETEKTRERIRELFDRPVWQKIQYSGDLFGKMFGQFYKRMVVPESLAERLIDFYTKGQNEGRWEDAGKVSLMVETLIQSLAFNRRIRDIDGLQPLGFGKTGVGDISDDNRDFWYYYLMVGFGFRRVELESGTEAPYSLYTLGSGCYLPSYIKYTYYPSSQWIRQFVGYSSAHKSEGGKNPTTIEFTLPDGKCLKVEFHLHYCLYTLDGKPVCHPVYTFGKFAEMAGKIEKTEQFFFLLAVTEIDEEERAAARKLIEERLSGLVLYPSTIPLIARMLSEGEEELVQTSDYAGTFSYSQKAVPVNVTRTIDTETVSGNKECETIEAVYYTEQEDSCFRTLVTDKSVRLYHQRQFGWYELPLPEAETRMPSAQMETEEREEWAKQLLVKIHKPQPVSLGAVSLQGMENEEKAVKILEALKKHEEYRRREGEWSPSVPEGEVPAACGLKRPAAADFYQKEGSFLTESYCVLRFGPEKRNERVFYCGLHPYAFQAREYNMELESTYQFRLNELSRKIKENHHILGNFGWGDVYTPKEQFEPSPFAIGESGILYNFDVFRMHRTDNLAALLAKMFDFTNVTEMEVYQGCLSFSRLDKKLEYCYDEEEMRKSMYTPDITVADVFVRSTRAHRMAETARWLNGILTHVDRLGTPLFVLEQQKENVYSLSLRDRKGMSGQEEDLMGGSQPLIWKIWDRDASIYAITEELNRMVPWYMDHGKYGWKFKNCLKIEAMAYTLPSGKRSDWTVFNNISRIVEAMKERTAMTAYSLNEVKKKVPSLFDTKVGGVPYWDPQKEYPENADGKKLVLLAQINLDKDPMEELIPGGGMLQFFGVADEIFAKEYGSRENQDSLRIIYHEKINYEISKEELIQLGVPDSTSYYEGHLPVSNEFMMSVEKTTVYMGTEDYRFYEVMRQTIEQEFGVKLDGEGEFLSELLDFIEEQEDYDLEDEFSNNGFWILGYPAFASNRKDPRKADKELRKYDRLLFQFDVHYLTDHYYYDADNECGIAHFFIREEDLMDRDFGKAVYHWENCIDEEEDEWDE